MSLKKKAKEFSSTSLLVTNPRCFPEMSLTTLFRDRCDRSSWYMDRKRHRTTNNSNSAKMSAAHGDSVGCNLQS